jgi:hypothetical protein
MAGLVPAIHALSCRTKNVDARDKPGHDGVEILRTKSLSMHVVARRIRQRVGVAKTHVRRIAPFA